MKPVLCFFGLALLVHGQEIAWLDGKFGAPRLMKATAAGVPIDSVSLAPGSLPQQLAAGSVSGKLFWAELTYRNAKLVSAPRDSSVAVPLLDSLSSLRGVAVDEAAGKIYWTTTQLPAGPKIMQANLNGSSPQVVAGFLAGGNDAPFGLALDVAAHKLYWTNFSAGKIQSCEAKPASTVQDEVTGLLGPVGIALDPGQKIYWTEANGNRIQSAPLSGGAASPVLTGLSRPGYLAVDTAGRRLYWGETQNPGIYRSNLDGSGKTIINASVVFPSGIVILPNSPTRISDPLGKPSPTRFFLGEARRQGDGWTVVLALPKASTVELKAYSWNGNFSGTLFRGHRPAGFNPLNLDPQTLSPGVYLLQASDGKNVATRCCLVQQ